MDIKNIIYENNHQRVILDFVQNQVVYNNITVLIEKELLLQYGMTFLNIMMSWKEEYRDTDLIDGGDWRVTINLLDNGSKECFGHGSYPDNFEALDRLISQIISEVF